MSDFTIATKTNEQTITMTPDPKGLLQRAFEWFWGLTNENKDMNTRPFDGIL